MKRILVFLFFVVFLTGLLFGGLAYRELTTPLKVQKEVKIDLFYGESIYHVGAKLQKQGILHYPIFWIWYARIFDLAEKIKAGEYHVVYGMTPLQLLDNMVKANVISYSVTLLDGWTSAKAIRAIQAAPGIVSTIDAKDMQVVLAAIGADQRFTHIEGLFYPDTYRFVRGTKDRDILKHAYERMMEALDKAWASRDSNLPYKDPYEVLIMASIVEKETAATSEREQIAGVFVKRLLDGMRLQTDPTVIYGMGENYKGNIRRKDLRTPSPYNTYTMKGLPPTPIALPSEASVQAAAHPLLNGMIFFVARGDGYHQFSGTLAEHEQAIRDYQLKRNKNYRSSPASP